MSSPIKPTWGNIPAGHVRSSRATCPSVPSTWCVYHTTAAVWLGRMEMGLNASLSNGRRRSAAAPCRRARTLSGSSLGSSQDLIEGLVQLLLQLCHWLGLKPPVTLRQSVISLDQAVISQINHLPTNPLLPPVSLKSLKSRILANIGGVWLVPCPSRHLPRSATHTAPNHYCTWLRHAFSSWAHNVMKAQAPKILNPA